MSITIEPPASLIDKVIALRRDFHRHPELGFEENRTAGIVAERLRELGYEVHTGIATTGVVGVLEGTAPGKTIMLRADMDALPIDEENSVDYKSTHAQTMHACGHDGHVAILLGAAELIAQRRSELAGRICLVFQPAEEGKGGGAEMVREGMLERFGIERAYGLHLSSSHPVGQLGFREGPIYASSDSLEITIEGRGGQIDPIEPAVVTIGAIHGGTTHNVIPSRVTLMGTVRAFNPEVRAQMAERIERVLKGVCDTGGATYAFAYLWRYPVTSNDAEQTRYLKALAQATAGEEAVAEVAQIMGAEDFSFYAEKVPACFYTLGAAGGPDSSWPHHHARFDIDEAALTTGVRMMSAIAFDAPRNAP
jgi:metal-dependent amidase/aminoacylase/carboxypeptidase family protein